MPKTGPVTERRLGEMEAQRETVGLATGTLRRGSKMDPRDERPTLAEAGIDKHLADRARKSAAIPEHEFGAAAIGAAHSVVMEAFQRLGQMLKARQMAPGGQPYKAKAPVSTGTKQVSVEVAVPRTLAEMGSAPLHSVVMEAFQRVGRAMAQRKRRQSIRLAVAEGGS